MSPQFISDEDPAIILASASPRRKNILSNLGFHVFVQSADILEERDPSEGPVAYACRLARQKGEAVSAQICEGPSEAVSSWVVAADTIVVLGSEVLEKPRDEDHARSMLRSLSGATHEVVTAFWVGPWSDAQSGLIRSVACQVTFKSLTEDEISRYIATGEPMDKAGAYGIQGLAGAFVSHVSGSYSAVVGLPIYECIQALHDVGALRGFPFGGC